MSIDDDPGADLQATHGRFRYFRPDELAVPRRGLVVRILVAGVGNVFFSDDGFGSEVARRLLADPGALPASVDVVDVGIRGMHLAYQVLDGYEVLVVVDAARTATGAPGTLHLVEHDLGAPPATRPSTRTAWSPTPSSSSSARWPAGSARAGSTACSSSGCVPADVGAGMGLSPPVATAVDEAVDAVGRIVARLIEHRPFTEVGSPPMIKKSCCWACSAASAGSRGTRATDVQRYLRMRAM